MPKLTKNDLLKVKTDEQLAKTLFPESEGYQYKKHRGVNGEIIVIIDDDGLEAHILPSADRPQKVDYTKDGAWGANVDFKFVFQPGKHLLILGKEINAMGKPRYRHVRVDWNSDGTTGITRSFLQILNKLEYGEYAAFQDLFDRREVTNRFYDEFIAAIEHLTAGVQNIDTVPESRRFAFAFAERLLFLHFVQTKNLLDRRPGYISELVKATKKDIYQQALKPLFFECLNKEGPLRRPGFGDIPYLDGGLFRPNEIEEKYPDATVTDAAVKDFTTFLGGGKWNWHLDERADVDAPNTLDPALLGHIFEKTVNQKDAGAYYTPRLIARYMAEQGVWGYLGSRLNPKAEPQELKARLDAMNGDELVAFARDHLLKITLLDNACGSGAFLLAGLDVLLDTWEYVFYRAGISHQDELGALFEFQGAQGRDRKYHLTKWLIGHNLYGTDIEPGAVEIAKLRLWLALITHAPDNPAAVQPLPNVDYNLRTGNALVGFTHWPKSMTSLASLEVDCQDLVSLVPGQAETGLEKKWAKGAPLVNAVRSRLLMVKRFRDTRDGKEAYALKDVIDKFDARVRPQIEQLWELELAKKIPDKSWLDTYRELRDDVIRPFHWWYEFPAMMGDAGPCVIITNPPWEKVRAEKREFHLQWWPDMRDQDKYKTPDLEKHFAQLHKENPDAKPAWERYAALYDFLREYFKNGRFFFHQGRGDTNFYKLFLEHYLRLAQPGGWIIPIVQGGIYGDPGCKELRQLYWNKTNWREMLGFENNWPIFDGVHRSFKIALMVVENEGTTKEASCFFMAHAPDSPVERERIKVTWDTIQGLYPETLQFPEVSGQTGISILFHARQFPEFKPEGPWHFDWMNELHRSANSELFTSEDTGLALVEGNSFGQFDYDYKPPALYLKPKEWKQQIVKKSGGELQANSPRLIYRAIARNTDARTVIVALMPPGPGAAHSVWVERVVKRSAEDRLILLGVMNSLVFDYLARRSVTANVTKEIMQSVRVPPPDAFDAHRVELVALVSKLQAQRGAYSDERVRLDAIVARVYGLSPAELAYLCQDFRVLASYEPTYAARVVRELEGMRK